MACLGTTSDKTDCLCKLLIEKINGMSGYNIAGVTALCH